MSGYKTSGGVGVSVFVSDDMKTSAFLLVPHAGRERCFCVEIGECSLFTDRANLERISAAINAALKEKSK